MKRRLRKKLGLGEFQEYYLSVEMRGDKAQLDDDTFLDSWIEEVEANDMGCGGGGGVDEKWSFVVSCRADLEGFRSKRERVEAWLREKTGVEEFTLSPVYADLTRAFHSSPNAAMRQQKINWHRGIDSEIWRD